MRLPSELTVPMRIRQQRKIVRKTRTCKPITGNYCKTHMPRMRAELAAIANEIG